MDGVQLMVLGLQLVISLLLFVLVLHTLRRVTFFQTQIRDEIGSIRSTLAKILSESETGYYDLLQSVEAVEKGVKKTAGLVVAKSTRDVDEPAPQMSVLDKKHLAVVLHQQGLSVEEISARLDIPQGELALMLRMSQKDEGLMASL